MRKAFGGISVFFAATALAGCGGPEGGAADTAATGDGPVTGASTTGASPTGSDTPTITPAQARSTPPPAFAQCRSCHSPEPGKHMIGPSLAGLYGTKAGDIAGFNFSPALKQSGIVWDEATLDAYIKAPRQMVPGTRMTYPGLKNDAQRAEVVAYLKTI